MFTIFKTRKWPWRHFWKNHYWFSKNPKQSSMNNLYMKFHDYKIIVQDEGDENYGFNVTPFCSFDVGDEFLDSRINPFEEGKMMRIMVFHSFQKDQL